MIRYPLSFHTSAKALAGRDSLWHTAAGDTQVAMAVPPEFQGPGGGASPEDLYAMALLNCFIATFKVYAQARKLSYESVSGTAELQVDRGEGGVPWMARIFFRINVHGAEDPESVQKLLESTSGNCMILNSVRTEKTFSFSVS